MQSLVDHDLGLAVYDLSLEVQGLLVDGLVVEVILVDDYVVQGLPVDGHMVQGLQVDDLWRTIL